MSGDLSTAKPANRRCRFTSGVTARQLLGHDVGERNRLVVGVALREVDQDRGHHGVVLGEVGAGQDVGLVLLAGEPAPPPRPTPVSERV